MSDDLPIPTEENIMKYVFGDEVSSAHLREVMSGPASNPYNEIVTPANRPLWARRDIPLRSTVLVNLAILACLNRPRELYTRCVGLLRGGISVTEIKAVFLHIGFYVGNPAGVEATAALHDAMKNLDERGIAFRETPYPLG